MRKRKWKVCHHWLTHMLFQTCITLFFWGTQHMKFLRNMLVAVFMQFQWMGTKAFMVEKGWKSIINVTYSTLLFKSLRSGHFKKTNIYVYSIRMHYTDKKWLFFFLSFWFLFQIILKKIRESRGEKSIVVSSTIDPLQKLALLSYCCYLRQAMLLSHYTSCSHTVKIHRGGKRGNWQRADNTDQVTSGMKQMARFTKQGKLALEHNSRKAQMEGENSAGDILTTHTLKNTDADRAFP